MSMICGNCKASYDCTCKERMAKDGTKVCSMCVANYNAGNPGQATAQITGGAVKKIIPIVPGQPNNVTVVYNRSNK